MARIRNYEHGQSVVKDHVQEAAMDGQSLVIIVDEAILSEPVHKMADPGSGGADHLCQCVLIYFGEYGFRSAFLAEIRKKQENPSQALFTGVEKLVYKIRFISDVAREQMRDKQFRNIVMLVKNTRHQGLVNPVNGAISHRNGCCHAYGLAGEASISEKIAGAQNGDNRLFALMRYDRQLYLAPPEVKYRIRRIRFSEDGAALSTFNYSLPAEDAVEQNLPVDGKIYFRRHNNLLFRMVRVEMKIIRQHSSSGFAVRWGSYLSMILSDRIAARPL